MKYSSFAIAPTRPQYAGMRSVCIAALEMKRFGNLLALFLFLPLCLCADEIQPDFSKLAAAPLFSSALEAARINKIPTTGIDPTTTELKALTPGDSVTASITLFEKRGHKSQWIVYVEAVDSTAEELARKPKAPAVMYAGAGDKLEFPRSPAPVSLRLLGPFVETTKGAPKVEDKKARVTLDQGLLGLGLDQAAAAFARMRQNKVKGHFAVRGRPFTDAEVAKGKAAVQSLQLSVEEQRSIAGSQMALMSYFHLVQQTPGLDGLFLKVVRMPSVWSLVRNLGVNAMLELERDFVRLTESAKWELPPETASYTFPLTLRINDDPALVVTLVVAPPRSPLLECGGIVGLLAEKPGDPKTYLLLRIISARHGKHSASVLEKS